jgi:cobalt/nickel transport system permease protein
MKFLEYINEKHWLSRVDPRLKLITTLVLLVMVISYRGFAFHGLIVILTAVLMMQMKVPWRLLCLRFLEPAFIVCVILLLKLFFSGQEAFFSFTIMGLKITGFRDGLIEGLAIGSRIIAAISVVAVLAFSTHFIDLIAALAWFKMPREFIEIMVYAYRYIFVLVEEAGVIYSAQKNRLGYASLRQGFASLGILAGSLIIRAFEHSQNITAAMVRRGYDGRIPLLAHAPFRLSQIAVSIFIIMVMGIAWKI